MYLPVKAIQVNINFLLVGEIFVDVSTAKWTSVFSTG